MTINTELLVSSPTLQDYIVDKDTGLPLAEGVITCYRDNNRTTLKNWYYQSGSPGAYTYITLPNPLTLSAVGTIVDDNGNDTIPFFYPFSETDDQTAEPYYITVDSAQGERQFTRQNFPFLVGTNVNPPVNQVTLLQNYIINNCFYQNIGSFNATTLTNTVTINGTNVYYKVVAPSQHDGFMMPDIQFQKDVNGATETITFAQFTLGDTPLEDDITPEYYINHKCTGLQVGETIKRYQFPIELHVQNLDDAKGTITIQAKNGAGNPNNIISIYIFQHLGTDSSSPTPIKLGDIALTNAWKKYYFPLPTFASASGLVISQGKDDAFYLQIGLPVTVTCEINFTLPSLYLTNGNDIPDNSFQTYDQINSIISTPRTGDFRISMNSFNPYGWVALNNGSIGNVGSGATFATLSNGSNNTWPLYNLLWNNVNNTFAPVSTGRGATAFGDYKAGKTLGLTQIYGRVLMGLPATIPSIYTYNAAPSWNLTKVGYFTVSSGTNALLYLGAPVYLTATSMPSTYAANTIYYAIPALDGSTAQFQLASSYANALLGNPIAAASGNGSGIVVNFALAGTFGESKHTQLLNELVQHFHRPPSPAVAFITGGTGTGNAPAGSNIGSSLSTDNTGGGQAFNIVQPSVYVNMFLKL